MPRPATDRLAPGAHIDLSPARSLDPQSVIASLGTIVHWSDSPEVRRYLMDLVGFPLNDVGAFLTVNNLAYRGALNPTELARILGTGRPNVTPEGRRIGERLIDHAAARVAESLAEWSQADRETLERLLRRLTLGAEGEGFKPYPHGQEQLARQMSA